MQEEGVNLAAGQADLDIPVSNDDVPKVHTVLWPKVVGTGRAYECPRMQRLEKAIVAIY
jgi:hypothetical protein